MTTPYRRGADFERKVRQMLQERGYLCWRVAGSKGEGGVDLIAFSQHAAQMGPGWFLIQCKKSRRITDEERRIMRETAHACDALPLLAYGANGKIFFNVVGPPRGEKDGI